LSNSFIDYICRIINLAAIKKSTIYKFLFFLVKVAIFSLALYYLYHQFDDKHNESIASYAIKCLRKENTFLMILGIFSLQFVNYALENLKWRSTFKEIQRESFWKTWKAVYAGNAVAIFTPDRLGTFIGRFGYLRNYSKTKITYTTFVGNYAQLTATLIFAMTGMILAWNCQYDFKLPEIASLPRLMLFFTPITILIICLFYYQEVLINSLKKIKNKWFQETVKKLEFVQSYSNLQLTTILLLALLRYFIFVIQFYLAIKVFQIPFDLTATLSFCGILYLFSTFIPSPFMGNLGTREAVGVYLLSNMDAELGIISASLLIWMINVVFPSILGGIIFLTKKSTKL
jgi:hypothetical protein